MRALFLRRSPPSPSDSGLAIERQSRQINNVLSGMQWLTINVQMEYRENAFPAVLRLLLSVTDKLLAGCYTPGEWRVVV